MLLPAALYLNGVSVRWGHPPDFVDYEKNLLLTDRVSFNRRRLDYLKKYNTRRAHASLQFRSPVQFHRENHPESGMHQHRPTN